MNSRSLRVGRLIAAACAGLMLEASALASESAPPSTLDSSGTVLREVVVPFDDLHLLLESGSRRVLLPRTEFEALRMEANRREEERPPYAALLTDAEYNIAIVDGRAIIQGEIRASVLTDGLHTLTFDLAGIGLQRLHENGAPAALGRLDDGRLVLFLQDRGERTLSLEATAPLQTTAARQVLQFRVPTPGAARLHLVVPGDVEIRSGATVLKREFSEKKSETRFDLLSGHGHLNLVMSLNSRLKRRERVVVARSVIVDEITRATEIFRATVSFEVLHQPVDKFSFRVPAGFDITSVENDSLAQWNLRDDPPGRILDVELRDEVSGTAVLRIDGLKPSPDLDAWSFPRLEPLDVVGHVSVVGVAADRRLSLRSTDTASLIPVDLDVMRRAAPEARPEEISQVPVRPVVAFYAPQDEYRLKAAFFTRPARVLATTHTSLAIDDRELTASGGLSVRPVEEDLFELDFVVPRDWNLSTLTTGDNKAPAYETYVQNDGTSRIHVRLPGKVAPGNEALLLFEARHVPPGWLDDWQDADVEVPAFRLLGTDRDIGAITITAPDHLEIRPRDVERLNPLDAGQRAAYGITGNVSGLAYRYDEQPYRAVLQVHRLPPRMTAESFTFYRFDREALHVHHELLYELEQAGSQQVEFSLPADTPESIAVSGMGNTIVKEHLSTERDGQRLWTVRLAEERSGTIRIAVNYPMTISLTEAGEYALPLPRAGQAVYQSGLLAVEGDPELDVRILDHPRPVDVGELVEAEYEPGERLMGAYGYVGEPPPVRLSIDRHPQFALPSALVEQAEIATSASSRGVSQSLARYRLRVQVPYLEVELPKGASLWSVSADDVPLLPQQKDGRILLSLPGTGEHKPLELTLVYESPTRRFKSKGRIKIDAPRLLLPGDKDQPAQEVQVGNLQWKLNLPDGFRIVRTGGTMTAKYDGPPTPAAREVADWLYHAAGGFHMDRGLIGFILMPLHRASLRSAQLSSLSSDSAYEAERDTMQTFGNIDSVAPQAMSKESMDSYDEMEESMPVDGKSADLAHRMKSMIIPSLEFRDANIIDVVEELRSQSQKIDPLGDGVNIVLKLPDPQPTEDPFGNEAASDIPRITLTLRRISFHDALQIITEYADLRFKIDKGIVFIAKEQLTTRVYSVLPGMLDAIVESEDPEDGTGARRGEFVEIGSPVVFSRADVAGYFRRAGVPHPRDASVSFNPATSQLVVRNTPENLEILERVVAPFRAGDEQVASAVTIQGTLSKMRSLHIDMETLGSTSEYHSLGVAPKLDVSIVRRNRRSAWMWAAGLAVFVGGISLISEPGRKKAAYILSVLIAATLLASFPGLLRIVPLCNAAFYAACLLVPFYFGVSVACWFVRLGKRWIGRFIPLEAAAQLLVALGLICCPRESQAAEMDNPPPIPIPDDVLVAPYNPDLEGIEIPGDVLVPYNAYRELWDKANPSAPLETIEPAARYAPAGARYEAELASEGDTLVLSGRLVFDVFDEKETEIPLPVLGAQFVRATLDGRPAVIRLHDLVLAVPMNQQAQRARQQTPNVAWVRISGKGRHVLDVELLVSLERRGGWRRTDATLPWAPATALHLAAPESGTEVIVRGVQDQTRFVTERPNHTIDTVLGENGRLDIQWRSEVSEGEIDADLTAEVFAVFDIQEDHLRLSWDCLLNFRSGERDHFEFALPDGYLVEKVKGENIRGWAREGDAGQTRLFVQLLKPAKERERIVLQLQAKGSGLETGTDVTVPSVPLPDAIRHSGRLAIRRSPLLDLRVDRGEGVRRMNLTDEDREKAGKAELPESPLGIEAFQAYEFAQASYDLAYRVETLPSGVEADLKTILRLAPRDRHLESKISVIASTRPIYGVSIEIPPGLDLDRVSAPGVYEWNTIEQNGSRVLVLRFAGGLKGKIPIVIGGNLENTARMDEVPVPRLRMEGVERQTGEIAIQADASIEVQVRGLSNLERMVLERVYSWLKKDQRASTQIALRYKDPEIGGVLALTPRESLVHVYTVTNVRVTDRTIEETHVLNYTIRQAGIRDLEFVLPGHLADARIRVPHARQKTVTPTADGESLLVSVALQDAVMNQLVVLVEEDRILSAESGQVRPPVSRTGRVDAQYVAVESAGRDEVEVIATDGLSPLGRQQKEWKRIESVFQGGNTQAYLVQPGTEDPKLTFQTRERKQVETAGARIGFARTSMFVDANGAYRANQEYHVDNRTEQFLEVLLPKRASLWTVRVAGATVKPIAPDSSRPRIVHIPLVKTVAGDLDYSVELKYGGSMRRAGVVRSARFPLIQAQNISVELSQVEINVPRTHRWFRFAGSLREIEREGDFEAGFLSYQNRLMKRLRQSAKFGSAFEKARAAPNLKGILHPQDAFNKELQQKYRGNPLLMGEVEESTKLLAQAEKELAEERAAGAAKITLDNRSGLNTWYFEQSNDYVTQPGQDRMSNFDTTPGAMPDAESSKDGGPVLFSGNIRNNSWFYDNSMATQSDSESASSETKAIAQIPEPQAAPSGLEELQSQLQRLGDKAGKGPAVTTKRNQQSRGAHRARGRRSQAELANRYQLKLEESADPSGFDDSFGDMPAENDSGFADSGEGFGDFGGAFQVDSEPLVTARWGARKTSSITGGGVGGPVNQLAAVREAAGLASLDIALPSADSVRWEQVRFTTPRGEIELSGHAISEHAIEAWRRFGISLVAALAVWLLWQGTRGNWISRERRVPICNLIIILGVIGLLLGIFPFAALIAVVGGIILRHRAKRAALA